ncbi:MAG: hypothetical protein ACOCP8_08410 [archaeon]
MNNSISVYIPKQLKKEIKLKNIDDDISLAEVCRNLIKNEYVDKEKPDLDIVKYSKRDYNMKVYHFELSHELYRTFNEKILELEHNSMSAIIVALLKKYYLKRGDNNG